MEDELFCQIINLLLYGTLRLLLSVMSFPLTELLTEIERKPSLLDDAYDALMDAKKSVEVTRLTSVQLLDAAIWREIGTEEPQPAPAFLEALSVLVGRWLLIRSTAPEMDAVTVLCKARGYIARHETTQTKGIERGSR